eukprot:gnl/MRDRNA2_/MRDRNA2_104762_c0_seq1.p1 gnl/MRDRNA2_/MRDRNA2_104762_c0~~gnl/MRDRNA2_/MRDRNA2_104762_c0_seq1.p1  ORF type:complete len:292 (-),score=69.19 gnl/MRDRNA2_/MRDRNA2_104762_c0_seq1:28-852(-)
MAGKKAPPSDSKKPDGKKSQKNDDMKQMLMIGIPILLVAIVGGVVYKYVTAPPKPVKVVTSENWDDNLRKYSEGFLVAFLMPGDDKSDEFEHELDQAGGYLKEVGDERQVDDPTWRPAVLGAVDCSQETELTKTHGITHFPTILWFRRGEKLSELPQSSREASKIVEFVQWAQQPPVLEVDSKAEVKKLLKSLEKSSPPVVVAFDGQAGVHAALESAAELYRGQTAFIFCRELVIEGSAIRAYGRDKTKNKAYTGEIEGEALRRWVAELLQQHR